MAELPDILRCCFPGCADERSHKVGSKLQKLIYQRHHKGQWYDYL